MPNSRYQPCTFQKYPAWFSHLDEVGGGGMAAKEEKKEEGRRKKGLQKFILLFDSAIAIQHAQHGVGYMSIEW